MQPPTESLELSEPTEVATNGPAKPKYGIGVALFLTTLLTTIVVGARLQYNFQHNFAAFSTSDNSLGMFPVFWLLREPHNLLLGLPFALSLMGILLAHELGHYLLCRRYGVDATLPYFIPAPTLIGTLGAFIKIRSAFYSRRSLFDIGVAGPTAGFIVSIPITIIGLALSRPIGTVPDTSIQPGFPLLFELLHRGMVAVGHFPAQPIDHLLLHPLAIAGWVGMFATSLNLLPGGQLDGGHMVFAFSERAHRIISWVAFASLMFMAVFFWAGWLVWAVVLAVTATRHPTVYDQRPMGTKRYVLLAWGILMLALSIIPAPFKESGLWDAKEDIVYSIHEMKQNVRGYFHK